MRLSRKRRAFTLTELLVVIGVIALLIGILLPSLARAREASRKAACLSNLRSLTQALHMYAQANNDRLPNVIVPGNANWGDTPSAGVALVSFNNGFVRSPATFHCPSNMKGAPSKIVTADYVSDDNARGSYDFFCVWFGGNPPPRISKMKGRAPMVWDIDGGGYRDWYTQQIDPKQVSKLANHRKGGNVAFADGHGEWQEEKLWDTQNFPHPAAEFYPLALPGSL